MKKLLNKVLHSLLLLVTLASGLNTNVALAANQTYIVGRLDWVGLDDDGDVDGDFRGPEGEIQYVAVVATGNPGEEPIVAQRTGFPIEMWYEAEDDGPNGDFMAGHNKAIPLFALPEEEMGDELVISVTVVDDDENSDLTVAAHDLAGHASTAVVTAMAGPAWGALVEEVSGAVQDAIKESGELDVIGTHTNRLRRSDNFGMPEGENAVTIDVPEGNIRVRYTVMRVTVREEYNDWCASVTLERIKVVKDGDGLSAAGIYIHARGADRYVGEVLDQRISPFEKRYVDSGDDYPLPDHPLNRILYFNECNGLPPFLYTEVGVFDRDCPDCLFSDPDDVLGVLPLMFTNRWLREHPGSHKYEYEVTGHDPEDAKAKIFLSIDIWDPNETVW